MKITGAEFKEWHDTAWPKGYVWDESTLDDGREVYKEDGDGEIAFAPDEVFTIPNWWEIYAEDDASAERLSIRSLIRKWRKERSTVMVVVSIPRAEADVAQTLFRERGWKSVP